MTRLGERCPDSDFHPVRLGVEPLPAEDGEFELVTALDVLYHVVADAEWRATLGEVARSLVPGGHAIVTDRFGPDDLVPAPHVRFRSIQRWREATAASDLRIVAMIPLYRWLSRDRDAAWMPRLADSIRGPMEFALELGLRRQPHLWMAVIARQPRSGSAEA